MTKNEQNTYWILRKAIADHETEKLTECFNLAKAGRMLGKNYRTIIRMIGEGSIKTTIDGKNITRAEINRYLKAHPPKAPEKLFSKTEPHKKAVFISPGQTALVIESKLIEKLRDALRDADTFGGYHYTDEILSDAIIIKNQ